MCYDISFSVKAEILSDYLPDIKIDPQYAFTFEPKLHVIAQEFGKYPVIIFENGNYTVVEFEWGLIPDYMYTAEKIKAGRSLMCNAQSEKIIGDHKSVWNRIRTQRCLIPVTGIFEHRAIKGWKKKVPYHVKLKDRNLFCIPGLYHYAPVPDLETGEARGTFTLITRAANSIMAQIHNGGINKYRMPLFLPKELEMKWLLPDLSDDEIQEILNYEMPSEEIEYWTVYSIRTQQPHPERKSKIDQYSWANLPDLGKDPVEEKTLF